MNACFEPLNGIAAPRRTLFVFPHAGSSPNAYRWLCAALPDTRLFCLSLPGRGARLSEPPLQRMDDIFADDLTAKILSLGGDEFAFFGHSMGGWIAHEAAQRLARCGELLPRVMHLSASRSPSKGYPAPYLHQLSQEALRNHVTTLARADGAEVPDTQIFELLEQTIRSDLQIIEDHNAGRPIRLGTELHCYVGTRDTQVTPKDVLGWQECTNRALDMDMIPGGHFYFVHEASRLQLVRSLMQ
ncbi:alpha/beta fold hydrolase [Yoonia sp. GPGPB17]|uniref:thioesterase II family protein n=1 Tax=Yoonia sp. GPGPB17 TaxID=3026147 RepID=UPI0030C2372A